MPPRTSSSDYSQDFLLRLLPGLALMLDLPCVVTLSIYMPLVLWKPPERIPWLDDRDSDLHVLVSP